MMLLEKAIWNYIKFTKFMFTKLKTNTYMYRYYTQIHKHTNI